MVKHNLNVSDMPLVQKYIGDSCNDIINQKTLNVASHVSFNDIGGSRENIWAPLSKLFILVALFIVRTLV